MTNGTDFQKGEEGGGKKINVLEGEKEKKKKKKQQQERKHLTSHYCCLLRSETIKLCLSSLECFVRDACGFALWALLARMTP